MKQYMLSVHMIEGEEPYATDEEMQKAFRDVDALNQRLRDKSAWVFGAGLHPPETATVVQVRDGDVLTTDGPFVEAKEHIGGFWIVAAADLDAALAWAAEATVACGGPVEVRPLQDETQG